MLKAAVIGHPVSHSLSPEIFSYWFKKYNVSDANYERLDITEENLKHTLCAGEHVGFNITMPHKQVVMQHLDEISPLAERVGAVNAITIKDGRLFGDNTDVHGTRTIIGQNVTQRDSAVVLGAGGASRAVCYGLKELGFANIFLLNRTLEKAEAIAEDIVGITPQPWDERDSLLPEANLVINTTSIGLKGEMVDVDLNKLNSAAAVADIVYRPEGTKLIEMANSLGFKTIDGIEMLIQQAIPCFERWFGSKPGSDSQLRSLLTNS